jgi:crotonobetainyl-CoA:carnitine CoA-transferase CaiB-like acyl-CoA transferase
MLRDSLAGIRVADFTHIGAGPLCGMYLAELGAEVIKVEPLTGDIARRVGPPWSKGESSIHLAFNRGKKSIGINLKDPAGLEIARDLVRRSDLVLESFRPGVMARLGLGYMDLYAEQKELIYCSISAYGQEGELKDSPGVDGIIQAASGLMSLIGHEGEPPAKVQAPIVDVATGLVSTMAVLAAFGARLRNGKGCHLDVSLMGAALALQQSAITSYSISGHLPQKIGSAAPYAAPNEAFEASDGWIMVAAYLHDSWERLCDVLGVPQLKLHQALLTSPDRVENRELMRRLLGEVFIKGSCSSWAERLGNADIMCSKVATYEDVLANSHLLSQGLLVENAHPQGGSFISPSFPINAREANRPISPPPGLGQHTDEILEHLLGRSMDEVRALKQAGLVV